MAPPFISGTILAHTLHFESGTKEFYQNLKCVLNNERLAGSPKCFSFLSEMQQMLTDECRQASPEILSCVRFLD